MLEWAGEVERRGAGEIILTSIDAEGTGKGYDLELIKAVSARVTIPVVACGGFGDRGHLSDLIRQTEASAAATAQALHWGKLTLGDLRQTLAEEECFVRPLPADAA